MPEHDNAEMLRALEQHTRELKRANSRARFEERRRVRETWQQIQSPQSRESHPTQPENFTRSSCEPLTVGVDGRDHIGRRIQALIDSGHIDSMGHEAQEIVALHFAPVPEPVKSGRRIRWMGTTAALADAVYLLGVVVNHEQTANHFEDSNGHILHAPTLRKSLSEARNGRASRDRPKLESILA